MSIVLTTEYTNSPVKFLEKHWFKSPTNIPGLPAKYRDLKGINHQEDGNGSIGVADDKETQDDCIQLTEFSNTNSKILHCDIDQVQNIDGSHYSVPNFSSILLAKPHTAAFRAYFLPWQQDRITYVTLEDPNTKYFFTSSLSGCSIFVTGTWDKPTVYHANARDIGAINEENKRQDYMNGLFRLSSLNKTLLARLTKIDYRPDEKIQKKKDQGRTFIKTGMGEDKAFAEDSTVVGMKKSGKWEFYFQLNIYMEFQRPRMATLFGAQKDFKGYKSYCAPIPKM